MKKRVASQHRVPAEELAGFLRALISPELAHELGQLLGREGAEIMVDLINQASDVLERWNPRRGNGGKGRRFLVGDPATVAAARKGGMKGRGAVKSLMKKVSQ